MTSPPDKLFRDGLGEYQKPAPPSAWDRVEANLDKKQPKLPWLFIRIAAGLLLVVAMTISLWPDNTETIGVASTETESPLPLQKIEPSIKTPDEATTIIEGPVNEKQETIANISEPKPKKEIIQQPKPQQKIVEVKKERAIETPIVTKVEPEVYIAQVETTNSNDVITTEPIEKVSGKVTHSSIAYSAEEVNARFRKKVLSPDATTEKKSASGFMKVIDTALDFKNDGSIIGELRDRKNELLSFNGPADTRDINK